MRAVDADLYNGSYGGTPVALDRSWGRTWQDRLSESGFHSINLQNDDPDLTSCDFGDIVRYTVNGGAAFAGVIEQKTIHRIRQGEERDQYTELKGRGTMALFDRMVVYPEGSLSLGRWTDSRLFNFSSSYFDDSSWGFAVEIEQGTGDPGGPRAGFPKGLPAEAETAWWIWSQANNMAGSVPAGDAYFRKTYTSPGEFVRIFITADNNHDFYLDNQLVESDSVTMTGGVGWAGIKTIDRFLTPGDHLFAVKASNVAGVDPNPSGFIMAAIQLTGSGSELGSAVLITDDSWKALGYPASPPGFTPGRVLEILRAEAVARGVSLPTFGFDATEDTAGVPWSISPDISLPYGLKGVAALMQLAESYVDLTMDPGSLTLNAWGKGSKGGPTSAVFAYGENVIELENVASG